MNPSPLDSTMLAPITLVGSGRVGNALSSALLAGGRSATLVGRSELADACAAPEAEVVLLCVPDGQVEPACEQVLRSAGPLRFIGHTSGATSLDALAPARQTGVETFSVHPLQTVHHPGADLTGSPAAVAGSGPDAVVLARGIAESCQMVPFEVPEESRAAYHAAAAMASNFLVTLEASAEELLAAAGIEGPRELLAPLVLRTAANWAEHGSDALTGPIARGDEATVARHLEAIADLSPELTETYRVLAERTRAVAAARGGDRG